MEHARLSPVAQDGQAHCATQSLTWGKNSKRMSLRNMFLLIVPQSSTSSTQAFTYVTVVRTLVQPEKDASLIVTPDSTFT